MDRVHQVHATAAQVARGLRVDGLTGPAEAYQLLGYLGSLTATVQELMSAVAARLQDLEEEGVLVVGEGPFVDEPEAALAVVLDAVGRASVAGTRVRAELERAQIAAADIGAAAPPRAARDRRGG